MPSVEDVIRCLSADGDPVTQVRAVEDATSLVSALVTTAVEALRRSPNRFLIAERLHRFGSIAIPELRPVAANGDAREARVLAALVLLQLKDHSGRAVLLAAVEDGDDLAGLCARWLVREQVDGAEEVILRRLKAVTVDSVDEVVSLICALRDAGRALPDDLTRRFNAADVPWQVRAAAAGR